MWSGFSGWRFLASHARWRRRCQFFSSVASDSGVRRECQIFSHAIIGMLRGVKWSRHAASQCGRRSSIGASVMSRLVRMVVISCMVRVERVRGVSSFVRGVWPSAYQPWFRGNEVVVGPMMAILPSFCSVVSGSPSLWGAVYSSFICVHLVV